MVLVRYKPLPPRLKPGTQPRATCLGEVAAELEMVQRGGVDSDDEGDHGLNHGEAEEEAEAVSTESEEEHEERRIAVPYCM